MNTEQKLVFGIVCIGFVMGVFGVLHLIKVIHFNEDKININGVTISQEDYGNIQKTMSGYAQYRVCDYESKKCVGVTNFDALRGVVEVDGDKVNG